jgi:hypothetical protein
VNSKSRAHRKRQERFDQRLEALFEKRASLSWVVSSGASMITVKHTKAAIVSGKELGISLDGRAELVLVRRGGEIDWSSWYMRAFKTEKAARHYALTLARKNLKGAQRVRARHEKYVLRCAHVVTLVEKTK